MEKAKRRKLVILVLSLAALVAFPPLAIAAGSLEPSAPPGPVMKSLDEVEPRIPIKASSLPLHITQPGSYYLTQDINFTQAHDAISVECNDVTIDLMGYTLKGPHANYTGIYITGRKNVEIRNGTVRDFIVGIAEGSTAGRGHRVINIRAISNTYEGIYLSSSGNLVNDCAATENGGNGIYALGSDSTITGNTVSYNSGSGIYATNGSTITGNTASYNGIRGIHAGGNGSIVTGNTVSNNSADGIYVDNGSTIAGNTASYNSGSGICVPGGGGSRITGNMAAHNTQDGIKVYAHNTVADNTFNYNGESGDGAGIHATGTGNRIEGNHVSCNDRGIDVDSTTNLIVKNSAKDNTVGYDIVVGNKVGTITNDPTIATAWANFDF
jgi:parallel beta-helix repeat protein